MQIILLERIAKLGQMGDIVNVKDGYARNYLLPQGKALSASQANIDGFEAQKAQLEARNLETRKEAEALAGRLDELAALARGAAGAVGNDTGPMHLICATGCSGLVLFSGHSDPVRHAPKGEAVQVLRENDLADLAAEAVFEALSL